jgi:hypothetical protein
MVDGEWRMETEGYEEGRISGKEKVRKIYRRIRKS